jgi:hypothetical protein
VGGPLKELAPLDAEGAGTTLEGAGQDDPNGNERDSDGIAIGDVPGGCCVWGGRRRRTGPGRRWFSPGTYVVKTIWAIVRKCWRGVVTQFSSR